jgi:hypothetical protein
MVNKPIAVETTLSTSKNAYIAVIPLLDDRSAGDDGNARLRPPTPTTPGKPSASWSEYL